MSRERTMVIAALVMSGRYTKRGTPIGPFYNVKGQGDGRFFNEIVPDLDYDALERDVAAMVGWWPWRKRAVEQSKECGPPVV
jgi:hypothetical protein